MNTFAIKSKIQNLNIVIGCTFNCPYCYARCNARRYFMTDDFSVPQFYESKLRLLENKKPHTFLLTGMSDFADWKAEWTTKIFEKIKANPQNHFIFLTKRPDQIKFSCDLDNVWIGVTVTCKDDLYRIISITLYATMSHCHTFDEKPRRSADKILLPYWHCGTRNINGNMCGRR